MNRPASGFSTYGRMLREIDRRLWNDSFCPNGMVHTFVRRRRFFGLVRCKPVCTWCTHERSFA